MRARALVLVFILPSERCDSEVDQIGASDTRPPTFSLGSFGVSSEPALTMSDPRMGSDLMLRVKKTTLAMVFFPAIERQTSGPGNRFYEKFH